MMHLKCFFFFFIRHDHWMVPFLNWNHSFFSALINNKCTRNVYKMLVYLTIINYLMSCSLSLRLPISPFPCFHVALSPSLPFSLSLFLRLSLSLSPTHPTYLCSFSVLLLALLQTNLSQLLSKPALNVFNVYIPVFVPLLLFLLFSHNYMTRLFLFCVQIKSCLWSSDLCQ